MYVFDRIENKSGSSNTFVFDFKNRPTGTIRIYVHNNVLLEKLGVSIINGGSASRIYLETHSIAQTGFSIANGSTSSQTKWAGTVWAPYTAISVGSGTGNSDIVGALWSGSQVNIQCGVSMVYAPLVVTTCTTPTANAGLDKELTCSMPTAQLTGTSTTAGVSYSWVASNGGTITSATNIANPTISSAGSYTLTVTTATGGCSATDVAFVTENKVAI